MSSGGRCPLTGNVLWWVFPCLCTFRPSGRKRLLVGKVLWWKLSSGGACPTCFPTLLYLPNCSPQKLCLVGYSSSSSSPLICTGSLLEHIKCWYPFSLPPKLHLCPLGQNWATPKGCTKRSLVADPHILRPKRRISTGMAETRRVARPKPKTSKDLKPKSAAILAYFCTR